LALAHTLGGAWYATVESLGPCTNYGWRSADGDEWPCTYPRWRMVLGGGFLWPLHNTPGGGWNVLVDPLALARTSGGAWYAAEDPLGPFTYPMRRMEGRDRGPCTYTRWRIERGGGFLWPLHIHQAEGSRSWWRRGEERRLRSVVLPPGGSRWPRRDPCAQTAVEGRHSETGQESAVGQRRL